MSESIEQKHILHNPALVELTSQTLKRKRLGLTVALESGAEVEVRPAHDGERLPPARRDEEDHELARPQVEVVAVATSE